jgi:WD40-like Beta Propeller Repeat
MRKKIGIMVFIIFVLGTGLIAQTTFWDSRDAYLSQKTPGDTPIVFAPDLLADSGYWAGSRVAFTNDGKQFIYGTNTNWFDGRNQKLKYFHFNGKSWKGPFLLFLHYGTPTFSTDGKTLLIAGRNGGIDQTHYSDSGWVHPQEFLHRSYSLYNFMPTNSGHYYAGSNGTWGLMSDFTSWKFSALTGIGSDTTIQSLGTPLNSPGFNGDFYISPDESYMIISAKESPTFESELYISFRKPDLQWTVPVSLGPLINNGLAHRWGAYVSPDHKYLFYTKGTSEKDCTIYWVRFDQLLKKLRQQVSVRR